MFSQSETIALYIVCGSLIFLLTLLLLAFVTKRRVQIRHGIYSIFNSAAPNIVMTLCEPKFCQSTILALTVPNVSIHDISCVICLEQFRCKAHVRAGLCMHPMHHVCFLRWIISNMEKHMDVISCPICRTPFEKFSIKKLRRDSFSQTFST